MAGQEEAIRIIDDFDASTRRLGIWTNITSSDVSRGLRERVANPELINQSGSMLCGPAAFAFDFAKSDPVAYVKTVINLYTGGSAVIGTLLLQPSKDLVFNRFDGGIKAVDWILLASLRDSTNWLFDVENVKDKLAAPTLPSTMTTWLERVGYTQIVNRTNVWFTKDIQNLRDANDLRSKGYRIFLFINSQLMYADERHLPSLTPNHWVMLQSHINIVGPPLDSMKTVSLDVYSWGEVTPLPDTRRGQEPIKLPTFFLNYYGFVAFKH